MSKWLSIGEIVKSISITHKFDKPKLKFLNTADAEKGKIINYTELPISELKGQAKKTMQKDDILFSEVRPKNKHYAYVDIEDCSDYVVSTKLMVLRKFNNNVSNKYFYYSLINDKMLDTLQSRAENRICSFPQITFDLLSEYKIRIPKISEQENIAHILEIIDKKIELNNKINQELEKTAKTLYDYWFVQFDFPDENERPYKSSGGKMVYNEILKREIPEGWKVDNLYSIADYYNGLACQKHRPTDNEEYLPVVKIGEMHNGITKDTEKVKTNIPVKNIITAGDILFSWSATLEIMLWTGVRAGLNQHIFKVVPKSNYNTEYVYQQLLAYIVNFVRMAEARKTTMGHITTDHLKQSKIVIPPQDIVKNYKQKTEYIYKK